MQYNVTLSFHPKFTIASRTLTIVVEYAIRCAHVLIIQTGSGPSFDHSEPESSRYATFVATGQHFLIFEDIDFLTNSN